MSVIDKLINGMKFNSDDQDLEEDMDYEDGYEDYEDSRPARRGAIPFQRNARSAQSDDDYRAPATLTGNAIVPSAKRGLSNMQVRVIKPSTFDQARQITDTLLSHRTVLLNLEGLDVNTAQRIVDFASGSCYALHGNFMRISHFIIVITPEDVDIAGDIAAADDTAAGAVNAFGTMPGMQDMGAAGSPFGQANMQNAFMQ